MVRGFGLVGARTALGSKQPYAPPGIIREIWMKNRKRGYEKREDNQVWVVKVVAKEE